MDNYRERYSKNARTWQKLGLPEIVPADLDQSNLPVREEEPFRPGALKPNHDYGQQFYDIDVNQMKSRHLEGEARGFYDDESMAAANQSFGNKFLSGVVSRGLSVIPKTLQQAGHIYYGIDYGINYMMGEDPDPKKIWDNWFVNSMADIDEGLREELPVYRSFKERHGGLLDQMGGAAFWTDDLFDGLAFLGSAYLTGAGIGAAGKGLGLVKAGTKGYQAFQTYGATALNSIGEAGFEAKDFQEQQRAASAYQEYGTDWGNLTKDQQAELDPEISEGAASVFRGNLGILIIPNYVQSRFLFGKVGQSAKRMRDMVRKGVLSSDDISLYKELLKGVGTGVVSEGLWEEGMQFALQKYNEKKSRQGENWDDYMLGVANQWVDNLFDVEGQKSMALGAIIGGMFGGIGGTRSAIAERKEIVKEELLYELVMKNADMHDKFYTEHTTRPFKKFKSKVSEEGPDGNVVEREIDTYVNPQTNRKEVDEDAVQRMFLYMINNKLLFDEAMVATINGDNIHLSTLNADALARLYYYYATDPGIETLDEVDNLLLSRDLKIPTELEAEGFGRKFTKQDLAPIREAYEKAESQLMDKDDFSKDPLSQRFKSLMRKTLYAEQIKRNTLEEIKGLEEINEKAEEEINRLLKDSEKMTKAILNPKQREQLFNQYKLETDRISNVKEKAQEIINNKESKPDDILRAMYEIAEFDYINGPEAPFSTQFPQGYRGSTTANVFGARFNFFQKIGAAASKKAALNEAISNASRGRTAISDIVNAVISDIKEGVEYSKEEVDKVASAIDQRKKSIDRSQKQKQERFDRNQFKNTEEIYDMDQGVIANPEYDARQAALDKQWLENQRQKENDYNNAKSLFDTNLKDLPGIKDRSFLKDDRKTYRNFQREFANIPIELARDLLSIFNNNPKGFEQATEIDLRLTELAERKRIYSQPGRKRLLQSNEFKGFIEAIDAVTADLSAIREAAYEAQESRNAVDGKSMQSFARSLFQGIGIKIDRSKKSYSIINEAVYNAIEKAIGKEKLLGILEQARTAEKDGVNYSFDPIFVEKIIGLIKENKKAAKQITDVISSERKKVIEEFINVYYDILDKRNLPLIPPVVTAYKQNPFKVFDQLIDTLTNRYTQNTTAISPIDKFLRDKNALELYDAIQSGQKLVYKTVSKEEIMSLLEIHLRAMSLMTLETKINSKINIAEEIAIESEVLRNKKHAPSNQQLIVLRDAVARYQTVLSETDNFSGWIYVKGLAGTGKTQLVSHYLPDLLKISPESIVALSTHERALSVLKNSIKGIEKTGLAQSLDVAMLKDESVKLLIIDEIARLSKMELVELAEKITEVNNERKEKKQELLRVFVLGDPSQVTSQTSEFPAISDINVGLTNIQETNPMTAVFRSGNSAIIRAQNVFLDFPGIVKTFIGISSADIGAPAEGVHVSNQMQALIAQAQVHKSANQRSRVVVVSNDVLAKQYEKLGIPVMKHTEVAGLEYDEVYVDIDPSDFDVVRKYNNAMYTALSRSKSYLFVKSYNPSWKYRTDKITTEENKERNAEIFSQYTSRLEFEAEMMAEEMKDFVFTSPQDIIPAEQQEEDVAQPETELEAAQEEVLSQENVVQDDGKFDENVVEKDGEVHELEYPSYVPIRDPKGRKAFVRSGSRVKYIKVWNPQYKQHEVWVVAQHINIDNVPLEHNVWERIGIVSEKELGTTKLGRHLRNKMIDAIDKGGKHLSNSLSNGDVGVLNQQDGPTILAEGEILKAQPLSYSYSKKDIVSEGSGFLTSLMQKVKNTFSPLDQESLEYRISIYSTSDNILTAGVPYLEIHRKTKKEDKKEEGQRSQFIRLTARRMRASDKHMVLLSEFRNVIREIEDAGIGNLGTQQTNEFIKRFRNNFIVENDKIIPAKTRKYSYIDYLEDVKKLKWNRLTKEQFDFMDKRSEYLIKSFYGVGNVLTEVADENAMWEKIGETLKNDNEYTYEFIPHENTKKPGGLIKITDKKDDTRFTYHRENGLEEGKGDVQVHLNLMAKSNKDIDWSVNYRHEDVKKGKKVVNYIKRAKYLFAEQGSSGEYFKALLDLYNRMYKKAEALGVEMGAYSSYLESDKHYLTDEKNAERLESVMIELGKSKALEDMNITPQTFIDYREEFKKETITSETLDRILSFDEKGVQNSLYYPLSLRFINNLGSDIQQNITQLEQLLGTKLESINRTRIQVKIDDGAVKKTVEKKTTTGEVIKDVAKNALDKIKSRRRRMDNKGQNLGREITFTEARAILEKMVPALSKEGKDVIHFVEKMVVDRIAGGDSFGVYRDEVIYAMKRGGKTFEKIIRHEVFHKIFYEFLSLRERKILIDGFKAQYPEHKGKSIVEIEELIAEKFQEHQSQKLGKVNNVLMQFFNWLAKVFGFVNLNMRDLDRFFATIESGYFVTTKNSGLGVTRAMREIIKFYGNKSEGFHYALDVYRNARSIIQDAFYKAFKEGVDGFPITRREARSVALSIIEKDYREFLKDYEELERKDPSSEDTLRIAKELTYYEKILENKPHGSIYNKILQDIYENWDYSKPGEIIVDDDVSTEEIIQKYEDLSERENLRAHIEDSDAEDQERKSYKAVKDFLSNILLSTGVYMNWREAYVRSLQLFEGTQSYSSQFIKQLENQYTVSGKNPRALALLNHIKELHNDASRINYGRDGAEISDTMKFVSEDIFIYHNQSVENIFGEDGAYAVNATVVKRKSGESTREFIIRISKNSGIEIDEISGHMKKHLSVDQLKALINLFNNQKQKNAFITEVEVDSWGVYRINYIQASSFGPQTSIGSAFNNNLSKKIPDKTAFDRFSTGWLKDNLKKYGSNQYEFVKAFLSEMGMGKLATTIPDTNTEEAYNKIKFFFEKHAKAEIGKTYIDPESKIEYYVDMNYILKSERSMTILLSKLMSLSSQNMRATNYMASDQKRKYTWSPSSFAHDLLFNLVNNRTWKKNKISLDTPAHYNTPFFKKNIFIAGKNAIHKVVDNDGIQHIDITGNRRPVLYKDENTKNYLIRTFVAGFLDRIRYSKAEKETYFQFTYPNERTNALGVEVNVLSMEQARSSLVDAITQINESVQISGIKENNRGKFINFRMLQKEVGRRDIVANPLKASEIQAIANNIMERLWNESARLAETIISERVPFDKDTFSVTTLNRFLQEEFVKSRVTVDLANLKTGHSYGRAATRTIAGEEYKIDHDFIRAMAGVFMINQYVNGYFLNQLLIGDYNQFINEEDVIRRYSLATAPGFKPIVNKVFGIPEKSRFMVISDNIRTPDDIRLRLEHILTSEEELRQLPMLMEKFEKNYDTNDGQGFMLPERFEELRHGGFPGEFSIHHVLKPVVFSIDEGGASRGIKYSSIVLTDELVSAFPSLGVLRSNMRKNKAMEAVFSTGIKIGMPESLASFEDLLSGELEVADTAILEVMNDHYRIQLDPKSKIDSEVSQPTQLVYLANVYEANIQRANRIYRSLAAIARLNGEEFYTKFGSEKKIKANIQSLLGGRGNERLEEMLLNGLSINFPTISDKIVINLASHLQKQIARIPFSGTKLILQSEYGVRKFNKTVGEGRENKLRFIRTEKEGGRLVAEVIVPEGLLPKDVEDSIKASISRGQDPANHFDLPDLLGFRIPSSDIHSGVAMKVVGFYAGDVNVIIAPDFLVALHGSDFDVDSLFAIKREMTIDEKTGEEVPVGYVKKKGRWMFARNAGDFASKEDVIKYHKNSVIHELLDILSHEQNVINMASPIPLKEIKDQKNRVINDKKLSQELDLSNFNDALKTHDTIFGAAKATGVFGNFAKLFGYIMRTAVDGANPTLRSEEDFLNINGKSYFEFKILDDSQNNFFVSLDGFINASIDNVRELALSVLNITGKTINGFVVMRSLGISLETTVNILQQPILLDYSKLGSVERVKALIEDKLKGVDSVADVADVVITDKELVSTYMAYSSVRDIPPAMIDGKLNKKIYKTLLLQKAVLIEFQKANRVGEGLSKFAQWLKIARVTPVVKTQLQDVIDYTEKNFGRIENDGDMPDFESKSFPFDITDFFKNNHHIRQIYQEVVKFNSLIETVIKKYFPVFNEHVSKVLNHVDLTSTRERDEFVRNEIITYLLSNEIYSGTYKLDDSVVFRYKYGKEERVLTGPKAINQIFQKKIDAVKGYILQLEDAEGNTVTNKFLDHLSSSYNPVTQTWELRFDGGTNMDRLDMLELRAAFYELNRFDVNWNPKTNEYTVIDHKEPRPDSEYSGFQKEFVSYAIMNWGLKFGTANYSFILPEDMYHDVDRLFNDLMDKFTGPEAESNWAKMEDDFMLQFMVNHGNQVRDSWREQGSPISTGRYVNQYDKEVNYYGGKTDTFFYDRSYGNPDGKELRKYIVTNYDGKTSVFVRLNEGTEPIVYYQYVDSVLPVKYYHTTDQALTEGYSLEDHFINDKTMRRPIYNVRVAKFDTKEFKYYGKDLKKADPEKNLPGDIVSFTLYHDIGRTNKVYKEIVGIVGGNNYVVKDYVVQNKDVSDAIITTDDRQSVLKNKEKVYHRAISNLLSWMPDGRDKKQILMQETKENPLGMQRIFGKQFSEPGVKFARYARQFNDDIRANVIKMIDLPRDMHFYVDVAELERALRKLSQNQLTDLNLKYKMVDKLEVPSLYSIGIHEAMAGKTGGDFVKSRAEESADAISQYKREESVQSLIRSIISRTKNQKFKRYWSAILERVNERGMTITFGSLPGQSLGRFLPDGTIILDVAKIGLVNGDLMERMDITTMHEITHGFTVAEYWINRDFAKKVDDLISRHFEIDTQTERLIPREHALKVLQETHPKYFGKINEIYGLKSATEFLSEAMSSPEFANAMDKLYNSETKKSLLREIIDTILEWLGFKTSEPGYNDVVKLIIETATSKDYVSGLIRTGPNHYRHMDSGVTYILPEDNLNMVETDTITDEKLETETEEEVDIVAKGMRDFVAKLVENSQKAKIDKNERGDELSTYTIEGIAKKIRRITEKLGGFISYFTGRKFDPNTTFGEYMADLKWGTFEKTHELRTDEGNMETYQQYKDRMDKNMLYGQVKGQIMHMLITESLSRYFGVQMNKEEMMKKINDIVSKTEGKYKPENYEWIQDEGTLRKVLQQIGVNVMNKDLPKHLRDVAYGSELTVWDEKLGFGGTLDALFGHADGRWSVVDWKTGRAFGTRTTSVPMKYGLQSHVITDNQRERAKLQVMIYAFILKLQNPHMKFRNLMVMWIPDRWLAEREDMSRFVEVEAYLGMIKSFLGDKKALQEAGIDTDIMSYILEKSPSIFNVSEYTDKVGDALHERLRDSAFSPEEELRRRVLEIEFILNRFHAGRQIRVDELPESQKQRVEKLYEEIAMMTADPSMQLDPSAFDDIGKFTEWMGNYSDISMDMFQVWVKHRNQQWNAYTQKHERDMLTVSKLVEPIYNEYMKGKLRIRRGGIDRVANVNYAELFSFAYKEITKDGYSRERLVNDQDPEWKDLTKDQQALLTYVNNKYASWFVGENAYLNQAATRMQDKNWSWLDLHNFGKSEDRKMKWYDGWFPKVAKTMEEVYYEEGARALKEEIGKGDVPWANTVGRLTKNSLRERVVRGLTWYVEDTYEGFSEQKMSIPVKYLDNFQVNNSRSYTRNLLFQFDKFNKSMLHKQHMDSVFATGQALKVYLQAKKYGDGQPMFENTVKFLEKKLIGDIQNKSVKVNYTKQPLHFGKIMNPITNREEPFSLDIDKIVSGLTHWTSMTIMWLRPLQGGGNGLHAKGLTWRESLKGTIASKFAHIDGDAIDFTVKDNVFADKVYFGEFQKNAMFGDLKKDKTWLLARKLNYIPDNYDYATNRRFLLSTRNSAISESSMYLFHSVPEEYVSLTTMIAQLHYLKNPKTGKNLWDSYQVEEMPDGSFDVVWKGGIRGYEKVGKGDVATYNPMEGLTDHEIAKLKKVHERMQGGYRKEEAANLEIYAMGKAIIQFKKYFPRLVMNALQSKKPVVDLGAYKKMNETRIDPETGEKMDVYEWVARMNEGRWRTVVNMGLAYLQIQDPSYKWGNMTSEQKQNIIDFLLTMGTLALTYSAYLAMFRNEPDDDTFKNWWMYYLVMNLNQQYNPLDLLHTLETISRPVAVARMYKLTEAFYTMIVASGNLMMGEDKDRSFNSRGQLKGWNEFMRSVPYVASYHDFMIKMTNNAKTEEWWDMMFQRRWR